ncbi:MAG TPA: histidinol-phosphate transaminase [Methanomicrobiales archaeon]|nr:histidinol-phosphate transaminase [Methanomicrobiales archaeon]
MEKEIPGRAVHGGTLLWHLRRSGRPILDFSANLNPFPPEIPWKPDPSSLASYPDDRYESLREEIGRTFHRKPEQIAVGNGSMEIIRVFCQAALSRGDGFFVGNPTFGEYSLSARLAGAREVKDPERARVRFLCNPNNPTGTLLPADQVKEEVRQARKRGGIPSRGAPARSRGAPLPPGQEEPLRASSSPRDSAGSFGPGRLFLDEAFIELSDPAQSMAGDHDPALFTLRSLTKAFAVPGLRFGYGFGDKDLVARMEVLRPPWSVNAFAEQFAILAFRNFHRLEESRKKIAVEREWLGRELRNLGLDPLPSSVNFLLVPLGRPAAPLVARLLARGILVRDCASFGLPGAIRIAVRTRDENGQLTGALAACLP